MAVNDLDVTAAQVAPCFVKFGKSRIYDLIAGQAVTAGQPVYIASDGQVELCDANSGTAQEAQFRGLTLAAAAIGQAVPVLTHGPVYGFDLSSMDYDDPVYLSDTEGTLADAASAAGIAAIVGRVFPLPDASATKVLFVDVDFAQANWS